MTFTFTRNYPPRGNRLDFTVTAGSVTCQGQAQAGSPVLYYVHADHLNTPRVVTDQQHRVVWRWENQEPFGNNPPEENPSGLGDFEFTAAVRWAVSRQGDRALLQLLPRLRSADGTIRSDQIRSGSRAGINPYLYVFGNPLINRDPFGLDVDVCFYADAAAGFGHVGFGLPGETRTSGFYPTGNPVSSPGQIKRDAQRDQQCKAIESSPDQDRCMLNCRLRRQNNPGLYQVASRQCTNFVRECLQECGLAAGDYSGPRPFPFFQGLPNNAPLLPRISPNAESGDVVDYTYR